MWSLYVDDPFPYVCDHVTTPYLIYSFNEPLLEIGGQANLSLRTIALAKGITLVITATINKGQPLVIMQRDISLVIIWMGYTRRKQMFICGN